LPKFAGEQQLMREMGLTVEAIERRKLIAGLGDEEIVHISAIRDVVLAHADELAESFFRYLAGLEEARGLTDNAPLLERARRLKAEHIAAMVRGEYATAYVEQRVRLALVYGRAGLDLRVFMAAFQQLLHNVSALVRNALPSDPARAFDGYTALQKLAGFDLSLIVDVLVAERERVIRQQEDAIRELSTPVLQIRERLLLLPIIGVIDTYRAQMITENLLNVVRTTRARVVVIDVTGVLTIDSKVANHLLQTVTAARLMGARAVVTGVSSEVAQSLVALGIDLERFNTAGDLQGGLEEAERILGYRVLLREPEDAVGPV
jgi:rsbT co-antagonist protein RsbR